MIGLLLVLCVSLPVELGAQAPQPASQERPNPVDNQGLKPPPLKIYVLEGEGALNSIPLQRSVTPVVEVRDERDRVIEGATVEFRLPVSGPGGVFPGNRTFFSLRTNAQGQAAAPFIVNNLPGKFEINISATSGSSEGRAVIRQTNTGETYVGPPIPKTPMYKRWTTWAIIGGAVGAGLGLYFGLRDSGSSTPVVIRPGGPIVGGPR